MTLYSLECADVSLRIYSLSLSLSLSLAQFSVRYWIELNFVTLYCNTLFDLLYKWISNVCIFNSYTAITVVLCMTAAAEVTSPLLLELMRWSWLIMTSRSQTAQWTNAQTHTILEDYVAEKTAHLTRQTGTYCIWMACTYRWTELLTVVISLPPQWRVVVCVGMQQLLAGWLHGVYRIHAWLPASVNSDWLNALWGIVRGRTACLPACCTFTHCTTYVYVRTRWNTELHCCDIITYCLLCVLLSPAPTRKRWQRSIRLSVALLQNQSHENVAQCLDQESGVHVV